jgi:hypothetical protein
MIPPGLAGQRVACPQCGTHVQLPGGPAARRPASAAVSSRAPAPKAQHAAASFEPVGGGKSATFELDMDDDPEDDDRPRRRKKSKQGSSRMLLYAALGGGGLVVVLLLVTLLLLLGGGGGGGRGSSLAHMVPADATTFVAFQSSDFWKSPSGQKVKKAIGPEFDKGNDEFRKKIGLGMDEVREMLAVMPKGPGSGKPDLIFVATEKPVDLAALQAGDIGKQRQKKDVGGKTLLAVQDPPNASVLVHASNILIVGDEAALTDFAKKPPAAEGPLAPAIRAAKSQRSLFFVGFQVPPELAQMAKAGPPVPMMKLDFVNDLKGGHVALSEGASLSASLGLYYPDAAKAKKAKEDIDSLLGVARMTMVPQMKGMPMPGMAENVALFEKALNRMRPTVSGTMVEVPIELDTTIGDMVEKFQPMMQQFGGGFPGLGGPGPMPKPGPAPGPRNKKKF